MALRRDRGRDDVAVEASRRLAALRDRPLGWVPPSRVEADDEGEPVDPAAEPLVRLRGTSRHPVLSPTGRRSGVDASEAPVDGRREVSATHDLGAHDGLDERDSLDDVDDVDEFGEFGGRDERHERDERDERDGSAGAPPARSSEADRVERGRAMRRTRPVVQPRWRAALEDRLPTRLRAHLARGDEDGPPPRLALGRAQTAVLGAICLVGMVVTGVFLFAGRGHEVLVPLSEASAPTGAASAASPSSAVAPSLAAAASSAGPPGSVTGMPPMAPASQGTVVVHVTGLVLRPGLVQLTAGARVDDAIRAAGGAQDGVDLAGLNLARPVVDGEQVAVGVEPAADAGGAAPSTAGPGAGASGADGPLDLNRATLQDLDGLPGVGPVLAQRILDWRTEHGRFTSVEELQEVSGIGPATFGELAPQVRV